MQISVHVQTMCHYLEPPSSPSIATKTYSLLKNNCAATLPKHVGEPLILAGEESVHSLQLAGHFVNEQLQPVMPRERSQNHKNSWENRHIISLTPCISRQLHATRNNTTIYPNIPPPRGVQKGFFFAPGQLQGVH